MRKTQYAFRILFLEDFGCSWSLADVCAYVCTRVFLLRVLFHLGGFKQTNRSRNPYSDHFDTYSLLLPGDPTTLTDWAVLTHTLCLVIHQPAEPYPAIPFCLHREAQEPPKAQQQNRWEPTSRDPLVVCMVVVGRHNAFLLIVVYPEIPTELLKLKLLLPFQRQPSMACLRVIGVRFRLVWLK